MRKIALLLIMSMMLTATACGKKEAVQSGKDTEKTETNVEEKDNEEEKDIEETENKTDNKKDEVKEENNKKEDKDNVDSSESKVDGSVGQVLLADFKNKVKETKEPQTLADDLITNKVIKFKGATMEVEAGPLNGFNEEIKGFKKGVMFSPMIGTIPFVGYIFTVADGEDVDKFVEKLEKNANLRWNVCTSAEEIIVEAEGNTVFFLMSPNKFEE